MHPDAATLWRAPRWALAILLACLGMLGAFSIDTFLPAFKGIAASLHASPVQMQQTLSSYLLAFAVMNLFHGALADSFGRRPVVLVAVAVFAMASAACAEATGIEALVLFRAMQGMTAGAGIVVARAVVRDMFPPADAQQVMAQITIFFGAAPAVAPIVGGFLFGHFGWQAVFWFLTLVGGSLWIAVFKLLPETLHVARRQPFNAKNLMRGYWSLASSGRFMLLALASGLPFNGMFLYVLSSPAFLGDHLGLPPSRYFWLFLLTISGIMAGAWESGRRAGRMSGERQIRDGFIIMSVVSVVNVVLNLIFTPHVWWALFPIALFSYGWALMVPVVTLMVLDLAPDRRGMASSLQTCVGSSANALVAGAIAPLVMHSTVALALTSFGLLSIGLIAWLTVRPHLARDVARLSPA